MTEPYVSWPPSPGGPAPRPPRPRGDGPDWGKVLLAVLLAPVGLVVTVVAAAAAFTFGAPVMLPAVGAGAVTLAVCRPRRGTRRNSTRGTRPAARRRPAAKTPPLLNYRTKKGR